MRRADLLWPALVQNAHPVAHGHGFNLIMGDEQESRVKAHLQVLKRGPHRLTQFGIQVGKGVVHQEPMRLAHDGPTNGHPLHLAARQPIGLAVQKMLDPPGPRGIGHPLFDLGGGGVADF